MQNSKFDSPDLVPSPSFWEQKHFYAKADVIVVGSGLVGLTTAIQLAEVAPKCRILVLDKSSVPLGASTRNAGFACFGSPSEIVADLAGMGFAKTVDLIRKRWLGIRRLRELVGDSALHFKQTGGYELFLDHETDTFQSCLDHLDFLNDVCRSFLGSKLFEPEAPLGLQGTAGFDRAIGLPLEGLIDPAAMIKHLLRKAHHMGIDFLTRSVLAIEDQGSEVQIICPDVSLSARQVVVATNGFATQLLPKLGIKPARNVVLVTAPLRHGLTGCYHHNQGYHYFRAVGDRILIGGGRHLRKEREFTHSFAIPQDIYDHLYSFAERHLAHDQNLKIDYAWSGIMGIGSQKVPTLQQHSQRVLVVAGLGGMGIAMGAELGYQASLQLSEQL